MLIMLVAQERRIGVNSDVTVAVPRFLSVALLAQGVLLFGLGVALYLVPSLQSVLWPWLLTPLTARAVAAWLVAFGLGAVLASRATDLGRLEISAWSYGLMAVLEFVVVIRYMDLIRWTEPSAWGYLSLLAGVLATSVAGVWQVRGRARTPSSELSVVRVWSSRPPPARSPDETNPASGSVALPLGTSSPDSMDLAIYTDGWRRSLPERLGQGTDFSGSARREVLRQREIEQGTSPSRLACRDRLPATGRGTQVGDSADDRSPVYTPTQAGVTWEQRRELVGRRRRRTASAGRPKRSFPDLARH